MEVDYAKATFKVNGRVVKQGDVISLDGEPSEILELLWTGCACPQVSLDPQGLAQLLCA